METGMPWDITPGPTDRERIGKLRGGAAHWAACVVLESVSTHRAALMTGNRILKVWQFE